jgi:AcrR family transcriptional regulator
VATEVRPTGRREYVSQLREQQAEQTRERILAAFAAQLARPNLTDFAIPDVAREAGVAVRTVYNHFPNREVLLDALASWLDGQLARDVPLPERAADLPALAVRLYREFAANEALGRAQASPGLARGIRRRRRASRVQAIENAVRSAASDPTSDQARWAAALTKHLIGADSAIALKDELGLSFEESGRAVGWCIDAMLAALGTQLPMRDDGA